MATTKKDKQLEDILNEKDLYVQKNVDLVLQTLNKVQANLTLQDFMKIFAPCTSLRVSLYTQYVDEYRYNLLMFYVQKLNNQERLELCKYIHKTYFSGDTKKDNGARGCKK